MRKSKKTNPLAIVAIVILVVLVIAIAIALTLQIIASVKGYTNFIDWGKTWSWVTKFKK